MIILKEIKKQNDTIEAKYYPENCPECGFLSINYKTEAVVKHIPIKGRERSSAPAHAEYELLRLSKLDKIPTEKTVIWY